MSRCLLLFWVPPSFSSNILWHSTEQFIHCGVKCISISPPATVAELIGENPSQWTIALHPKVWTKCSHLFTMHHQSITIVHIQRSTFLLWLSVLLFWWSISTLPPTQSIHKTCCQRKPYNMGLWSDNTSMQKLRNSFQFYTQST